MDLVIKIPKEFEDEFKKDKFEDSLSRVASDIGSFGFQLAGRYELETITMLREAFKNGTPVPEYLSKIKDEIEKERTFQRTMDEYDMATGLRKSLEIIDKHLEGSDSK